MIEKPRSRHRFDGRVATEGHPYKTRLEFVVGVALRGHPSSEIFDDEIDARGGVPSGGESGLFIVFVVH